MSTNFDRFILKFNKMALILATLCIIGLNPTQKCSVKQSISHQLSEPAELPQ